ncbi:hypothetical protein QNI23_003065 [Bermanella sp. WJH001]|mgnify:CR=1 FL=1|uniref:hypothetical protein n=1 Tax=Bermanella sp. WJH001 TaxID=3048005 RepID=UPI0024BE4419|nr:hypothetical protein [Bermanella sp. WJH001]MDJ1538261.1 hypothetical protein [Bermanella sp. WJH001]
MIKHALLASAAILLPAISYADVELTNWGTSASAVTFSDCPSYCTGEINITEDGAINQTSATITYSDMSGSADVLAQINGSDYTPVLKARSISEDGRGVNANAYGIQQYTYTGSVPTTIDLFINLHGVVLGEGQVTGRVAVIKGDDIPWTGDMGTLVYELVSPDDVLAYDSIFVTENSGENASMVISFDVEVGDTFFVRADLLTRGRRGGSADAYNTFTMEFDDATQLIASSNPEPQPEPTPELTNEVVVKYLWSAAYNDQRFNFFERFVIYSAAKILGMSHADISRIKNEVKAEAADIQ